MENSEKKKIKKLLSIKNFKDIMLLFVKIKE